MPACVVAKKNTWPSSFVFLIPKKSWRPKNRLLSHPPHSVSSTRIGDDDYLYDDDEKPYKSEQILQSGIQCQAKFGTQKQLLHHKRWAKGHAAYFSDDCYVLTNQCPLCLTTLISAQGGKNHFRGARKRLFCNPGMQILQTPTKTLDKYECPKCQEQFSTSENYSQHLKSVHFPNMSVVKKSAGEGMG